MEETTVTRRDGGPGPSSSRWRWWWWLIHKRHEQIGSADSYSRSSSRSGTIVSAARTSDASGPSRSTDSEHKIHDYDEHLSWSERIEEEDEKIEELERMKRVIELVNGGVKGWFTELEVAWVLDLPDDDAASAPKLELTKGYWTSILRAPSWIHALAEIVETIRSTPTLPPPDPFSGNSITDQIQFARFTQVAMLKLLAFVDVLVAMDLWQLYSLSGKPEIYSYHKSLNPLLDVHRALSKASHVIDVLLISTPPGEVQKILGEIFRLLSTMEDKALDAIWLTLNDTTTLVLKQIQDLSLQQGSSGIHEVTWTVISHISFLVDNKSSLGLIISEAYNRGKVYVEYESRIGNQTHSDSMIIWIMASRLQEELASRSETFFSDSSDQGLRFLFLLSNSHRLYQCLRSVEPKWSSPQLDVGSLFTKVHGYLQSYIQVSWAPVLSCLFNPTPHCFLGKNYSLLTRFESEFQEAYITQKHWKVPDPGVRKNLRTAIIEQIIPGYTKYIEDNNITTPRFAPQELEEMLQDLFEG